MRQVLVKNGLSMGYLVQTAVSGSKKSCWEEASSQMHRLNKAQLALDQVTQRIVDGDTSEETLNEQAEALTAFEAAGGYNVDEKVASVLSGLGFAKEDYEKSCTEFSGGWQMKIALARLLLSEPEMLLLDEPTNHLDAKAKAWLGRYISSYDGTVVIVTHEEALLESARLTQVIEVRDQQAHMFRGSYDKFLEERVARVERAQKEYEEQQREIEKVLASPPRACRKSFRPCAVSIAHDILAMLCALAGICRRCSVSQLESYITRFGAKMSHAASAQSKKKALDRIERVQAPTDLEIVEDRAKLRFPRPQTCERDMITLKGATWGWNNQALYKDANIVIERGMRLVILGPNGCGKSTLLAALSGRLPLMAGSRSLAESLEMGVFTQDLAQVRRLHAVFGFENGRIVSDCRPIRCLAQDLDMDAVALDVVLEHVRHKDATITNERARAVMGALGLTGSKALQKIGTMSGGEKARVALSMFVLVPHNLLILDEPSNHLDMSTVQVLTEALQEYQGTIVVVTHNRPFCELLAPTHVATVLGSPGSQTVKIEERPLRASDWEGMEDAGSASGVPGASSRTMDRKMGTTTLSKKKGGGSATLKKGKNAVVEEEAPQRELFPWEMDGAIETGLKQNKQGKLVSVEKKLTPQQKKLEKMKNKAANDDEPQFKDKFEFQGKGGNGKAAKGKGKGKK